MTQVSYLQDYQNPERHIGKARSRPPQFSAFEQDVELDGNSFTSTPVLNITSGVLGIRHMLGDGRQTISMLFFPGELLDFRCLLDTKGTVSCLLPVTASLYDGDEYDRLQRENAHFNSEHIASNNRQYHIAAQHCVDLARKSSVEKLASFIFECRNRLHVDPTQAIALRLRRSDIADYMGLRVETLSRAFSKLKQLKMITANENDEVTIINEPALRMLANGAG